MRNQDQMRFARDNCAKHSHFEFYNVDLFKIVAEPKILAIG